MNIAVFLPNWIGDLVMATPTLRALRRQFGQAEIVGIMRPYLSDLLRGTDWLDEQWFFDPRAGRAEIGHRTLVRRMRQRRFDMAVLLPNSLRVAVLAWLGRAAERIGFVRDGRGAFLTGKVYLPQANGRPAETPMVDYYLRLAEVAGCPPESRRLELAVVANDERSADRVWNHLGLRTDGQVVTFNSSGAFGGSKLWPTEHFAALARRVAAQLDHDVLVMCGPHECDMARAIVAQADHPRVFSMADQPLDLGTSKACIRRSRLMVSTDSGPRHIAAALDRPVITLFGPLLPVWSENPTQRAVNLILDIDCAGCGKPVCPLGHHRCMRDLKVDTVYAEVEAMLEKEYSLPVT